MKRKKSFLNFAIGLSVSFFVMACNNPCKHENCKCDPCAGDSCRCDSVGLIVDPPEEQPMVNQAIIYLDNSESMRGYVGDIKGYTDVLTQLTHAYKNTQVLLCCNEYKPLNGDLVSEVKKLKYGGSSLLHNDMKAMLGKAKAGTVLFFVTDGIMSGKDTNIKEDYQWTLSHASYLKLKIKELFAEKNDVAVSIYQFAAQFNGKYFCYDNSNTVIRTTRYFYVFVMGQAKDVNDFKEKYVGSDYFKPTNQLHFIDHLPLSGGINVKNAKHGAGDVWEFDLEAINKKSDNPKMMEVTITSDLFKAELNDKQIAELDKSFDVKIGDKNLDDVTTYDEAKRKYFIVFRPAIGGSKFNLEIAVPFKMPAWVASSSCSDDQYMKQKGMADSKTFLLQELIDGIRQGKLGNTENIYQTTVRLKRK